MPKYDLPIWASDDEPFPVFGIAGAGWKITAPDVTLEAGAVHRTAHFKKMRKKYPEVAVAPKQEVASRYSPASTVPF